MQNTPENNIQPSETPEESAQWEKTLNSEEGQDLMNFLLQEANEEFVKGKFSED